MRISRIMLALAALVGLCLVALAAFDGEAGTLSPRGYGEAVPQQTLATPVKAWRDCQEIALCTGCKPVYKCRSCKYQKACGRGFCEWRDVCVWGPYVRVLPPNARIIRIR